MSDYRVNLDIFAGPLDLLLYLVRKDEVDIYDIPISTITEEYIKYIEILKSLDIDLAGDFLVMAATLMEIKSAMLLPKAEIEEGGEDELIDPRSELIRQLLEYKKFKDAANLLDASALTRKERFTRPDVIIESLQPDAEPEVEIEQISVWDLLAAFDDIMKATGSYRDFSHIKDDTPIDLYEIEILDRLQRDGAMTLERIFEGKNNKLVMVGMFLAMLELMRQKLIWAEQEKPLAPIYIKSLTDEPAEQAVQHAILADMRVEDEIERLEQQNHVPHKPAIPIQEIPAKEDKKQDLPEIEPVKFDQKGE